MGDSTVMREGLPRPGYEPFPVAHRKRSWLDSLDDRLHGTLPQRAYVPMLVGYHGIRMLARRNPGRGRMLPDFVIIGAAKGGTTSLYAWLCEHPYVARATVKEVHYFSFHHYRGADWYRAHFPRRRDRSAFAAEHGRGFITGEGSPSYLPGYSVPRRMAKLIPQAKLIVSLREPIGRAYSQFHMRRRDGFEPVESFLTAVALEDPAVDDGHARARGSQGKGSNGYALVGRTYLQRSRYAEQLERWLECFPREQIHVLSTDDLAADPQAALDGVHEFLGLAPRRADRLEALFTSHYEPLPEDARAALTDYFRPHNQRLYELLGRDFGWER